ncbi:ZrgA family zinc uptake protein [Pseudaquabacterium pictum]|uniref:DUF2796 domain-containing protein n=1 Tax=Pseudaquabacterium pictum TaxID=2315236 RepID=A0A480AVX7_9BURK|nr:DUF2796 domain-containing protein [Rubrivivax pictus]GCL62948.1 hypothetical protein AQPW35_20290 [Rubrivivax pictus]
MTPRRIRRHAALALALSALLVGAAQAAGAHQHGVAALQVVVDGNSLTVSLDSPLDNLLGFERGPRTEAERKAVQAMAQRLRNAGTLLVPAAAAQCQLQGVDLASDVIAPALLAATAAATTAAAPAAAGSGHADLEAGFRFQCAQPQALKALDVAGLFQAFPRLKQLDAALAAPGVQRGAKLRPKQATLAW